MKRVLVGAGSAPEATVVAVASLMPHACIMSAYGMTEAASSITFDTLVYPANVHAAHAYRPSRERLCVGVGKEKVVPTPKWLGVSQTGAKESHCVGQPAPAFQVAIEILREDDCNTLHNRSSEGSGSSSVVWFPPHCIKLAFPLLPYFPVLSETSLSLQF